MPYIKKNISAAERSEIARKANAARKNRKGGRPKLSPPERKPRKVLRSVGMSEESYRIFRAIADYIGKTLSDTMDDIAQGRKAANPKIFAAPRQPPKVDM